MARAGTFRDWLGGQHARLMTRKCRWGDCPCGTTGGWHDGRLTWYGDWLLGRAARRSGRHRG